VFGSPVGLFGVDSNVTEIGQLTALHCAIGWHDKSLYPGTLESPVIQACTFGITLGNSTNSTSYAPKVIGYYCEDNEFDIVQSSNVLRNGFMAGHYELQMSKWYKLAPRTAAGVAAPIWKMFGDISFEHNGRMFRRFPTEGGNLSSSARTLRLAQCADEVAAFRENTQTITLEGDAALNAGVGITYMRIVAFGSGPNRNPTGDWTVTAATVSGVAGTINGASSATFNSAAGPFILHCYWQVATNNWIVVKETIPTATPQTYTTSNVTADRAFDANATTVEELADVLGTLIADLRARGVVL